MKRTIVLAAAGMFLSVILSTGVAFSGNCDCDGTIPPFVTSGVKPNVLIIFDNSNSMDENFYGEAVGSYASNSKSVIGKKALRDLLTTSKDKLRAGLMTYRLRSDVSSYYIHNSPYFVSYQPSSYCADPPQECVDYCITGDSTKKNTCEAACPGVTASFTDSIISSSPVNSDTRKKYCPLIFPKTQKKANPTDSTRFVYYKHAYPAYSATNLGTKFAYSNSYDHKDGVVPSGPWDNYNLYSSKTGTEDIFSGYTSPAGSTPIDPTDSDIALGYYDFGQRLMWYYIGPTWYSKLAASPADGKLQVGIGELSDTTQFNTLYNKLYPTEGDSSTNTSPNPGYMSCSGDKNNCSYIVNAGLTPTAGTLDTALKYFKGTLTGTTSPIDKKCRKNYILYITDGLPSVKLDGSTPSNPDDYMQEVKDKLSALRTQITKTFDKNYKFEVKTYVLGVGLSEEAKTRLDEMAVAGGTAETGGHAYYADDPSQLNDALTNIVADLLGRTASGSSLSILSEKATQGANIMQAVFYPSKFFGAATTLTWTGYLYTDWLYLAGTINNVREDTAHDYLLRLQDDWGLEHSFNEQDGLRVDRTKDANADGLPEVYQDTVTLDDTSPIQEAGKILSETPADLRKIYTVTSGPGLEELLDTNAHLTGSPSLLGNPSSFSSCLAGADDTATLKNLINFTRGVDRTDCRRRALKYCHDGANYNSTLCEKDSECGQGKTCKEKNTWKLGDIVYSTPKVSTGVSLPNVNSYSYCYNATNSTWSMLCTKTTDCGADETCEKKESLIFAGANDGMLHAFKTGALTTDGLDTANHEIAKLTGIPNTDSGKELWAFIPKNSLPYLRCLADPNYCHLYYVDLSPYITQMTAIVSGNKVTKQVLIGGMRLGGSAWNEGKYCLNSSGNSDGKTCKEKNDCVAPYNDNCSTAYYTAAPPDTCPSNTIASNSSPCADPNTCYNPSTCTGLSSYFALDITDAENPVLLWEFSHPQLGYTFSGPAVIHKMNGSDDQYHIMFLSGPTKRDGSSTQSAKAFILTLTPDLRIGSLYAKDLGNTAPNGFGGRLFTKGLDVDANGTTDFVLFGYSYSTSGNIGDWKGGIAKVWTGDNLLPANWDYDLANYFNISQVPVTAKIESGKCFDKLYTYAASGRYFYKLDTYATGNTGGADQLMGVPFLCDANNQMPNPAKPGELTKCGYNINYNHNNSVDTCKTLTSNELHKAGWTIDLETENIANLSGYLKERVITDPLAAYSNVVNFVSTEPTNDECGFGGRTRAWQINCATGAAVKDVSCSGYKISTGGGTIYLQTSTGAITKIDPASSFTKEGGKSSEWIPGISSEDPPAPLPSGGARSGQVLQWIEK